MPGSNSGKDIVEVASNPQMFDPSSLEKYLLLGPLVITLERSLSERAGKLGEFFEARTSRGPGRERIKKKNVIIK